MEPDTAARRKGWRCYIGVHRFAFGRDPDGAAWWDCRDCGRGEPNRARFLHV